MTITDKRPSERRGSFGGGMSSLGAALRRSTSIRTTTPTPPPGTATTASEVPLAATPNLSIGEVDKTANLSRPSSDGSSGLPARREVASSPAKPRSRSATGRRHQHNSAAIPGVAGHGPVIGMTTANVTSSISQPPLSRTNASAGAKDVTPHLQPPARKSLLAATFSSVSARPSPVLTPQAPLSGASTPLHPASSAHGAGSLGAGRNVSTANGPALHNLEESYVGKVSLRLGEAVNKVFAPPLANASNIPATATLSDANLVWKGRSAPRWAMTRALGELLVSELHAAHHDAYLLRTLLRSSVLKSMSLFLTRLTTLLLPPDALPNPLIPPQTPREVDALPVPLRFNLQVVRCAFELKEALKRAGDPHFEAPAFVGETMKPWIEKLEEVMSRVMGPLVGSLRSSVTTICSRARTSEKTAAAGDGHPHLSVGRTMGGMTVPGSAQLRSLSLGRSASPAPSTAKDTAANAVTAAGHGASSVALLNQPAWIKDLSNFLEATTKLIGKVECGKDADKWFVSIGTCAVWKGMLALSARKINMDDSLSPTDAHSPASTHSSSLLPPAPSKGLFKSVKKSSPPASPSLSPTLQDHVEVNGTRRDGRGRLNSRPSTATDQAFIRFLGEIELFEGRLLHYVATSLHPCISDNLHNVLMSGTCADISACGLCKTGRKFDAESSDDEDEHQAGRQGLAHSAMREAMQALSAMIIVVRVENRDELLKRALIAEASEGVEFIHNKQTGKKDATSTTTGDGPSTASADNGFSAAIDATVRDLVPLTPLALLNERSELDFIEALPGAAPVATAITSGVVEAAGLPSESATTKSPSSPSAICPTLAHALDTLPTLILLHLFASRLPNSISFRLPHELWSLDWTAYERELRGFVAAEEWTPEIGWEMANEIKRVLSGLQADANGEATEKRNTVHLPVLYGEAKKWLDLLAVAIRTKVSIDVVEIV